MLTQLIDLLSDDSSGLENALRKMMILAYRSKSAELKKWIHCELDGYGADDDLPAYRKEVPFDIELTFQGGFGVSKTVVVQSMDIPKELRVWDEGGMSVKDPVASMEVFARETRVGMSLPKYWVARYAELAEEGRANGYSLMVIDDARIWIQPVRFQRILSTIRTRALSLALELEGIGVDFEENLKAADETSARTIENGERAINIFIETLYGKVGLSEVENIKQGFQVADHEQNNFNLSESFNVQKS